MTLIERYIFKIAFTACAATLLVLAAVVWISQAVREFDLVTAKGQTLIIFLTVTGLSFPALITVIAPVALFIAVLYALNRLGGDSELVVMSAAGMSPIRVAKPFMLLTLLIATLVAWLTLIVMPSSFQSLRDLLSRIRADVVSNIVREGQFTPLDRGIIFHFREKSGAALEGIFIQDRRDPDRTVVYVAERGQTVETEGMSYLVLENGSVQRENRGSSNPQIVAFQRYAFDLSQFGGETQGGVYSKPRERTTLQLLNADPSEPVVAAQLGRFRTELHDRFAAPLYPFAFAAIAFAAIGTARTTRQGRGIAMGLAVAAIVGTRILGFAASSLIIRHPSLVPLAYLVPLTAVAISILLAAKGDALLRMVGPRRRASSGTAGSGARA